MATYYVRPTNGSDVAAGTSFAAAFKTFQKALDTAASASDVIRLCPEAVETTAVTVDFDTNAGGATTPIIIEPGNTTDGGRDMSLNYTIQASGAIAAGVIRPNGTGDNYKIYNLIVDANANADYALHCSVTTAAGWNLFGCRFTNAVIDNIFIKGGSNITPWLFAACETDLAGGAGIRHQAANSGVFHWIGGSLHDNGTHGWHLLEQESVMIGALVYDNVGDGVFASTNSGRFFAVNNTVYGNGGDGFDLPGGGGHHTVMHNSFVGNGGYGMKIGSDYFRFADYNHTDNNTSGGYDTEWGDNNITGDPKFTSVTDGSEDFSLQSDSPLFQGGQGGRNIGAFGLASAGGGGAASVLGGGQFAGGFA